MKNKSLIFIVILFVGTLTQIATDMYTPSLPAIALSLHATMGQSQLTMTYFILGVGFFGLFYGPLSEVVGRRWSLMVGLLISILGTILCLMAHDIVMLQLGRFIQGAGLGAASALWRSIFRDTYSGEDMARAASYLTNFIVLSVIAAPFVGGYIEHYAGWRVTFLVLLIWMLMVMLVILFLYKETGEHHGKHRLNVSFIMSAYRELCISRQFIGISVSVLLTYGGLFTWLTAGPVVLIHGAHVSPVIYGYLSIFIGVAYAAGSTVNGLLVKKVGIHVMMCWGWLLMTVAGGLMLVGYQIFGTTVVAVMVPAFIFLFGTTFIFSNAVAQAFTPFGHIAGYAGSLYSCIQLSGGALFSGLLSHFNSSNQVPMASMYIVSALGSWLVYVLFVYKKNEKVKK